MFKQLQFSENVKGVPEFNQAVENLVKVLKILL